MPSQGLKINGRKFKNWMRVTNRPVNLLSSELDCQFQTIYDWISGKRRMSGQYIKKFRNIYGIDPIKKFSNNKNPDTEWLVDDRKLNGYAFKIWRKTTQRINQTQFASIMQVQQKTVSKWETEVSVPNIENRQRFRQVYGFDMMDRFGYVDQY